MKRKTVLLTAAVLVAAVFAVLILTACNGSKGNKDDFTASGEFDSYGRKYGDVFNLNEDGVEAGWFRVDMSTEHMSKPGESSMVGKFCFDWATVVKNDDSTFDVILHAENSVMGDFKSCNVRLDDGSTVDAVISDNDNVKNMRVSGLPYETVSDKFVMGFKISVMPKMQQCYIMLDLSEATLIPSGELPSEA